MRTPSKHNKNNKKDNTILYYTILYYTILYYTILYHTILYYTVLYCTILSYTNSPASTETLVIPTKRTPQYRSRPQHAKIRLISNSS